MNSADKFVEAFEHNTKGLEAVSPGVCGGCAVCRDNDGFEFHLSEDAVTHELDDRVEFRDKILGKVVFSVTHEYLRKEFPDEEDTVEAAKDEFRFSCPDIPEEIAEAAFSDMVSKGKIQDEGNFSWSECDTCGSSLGGDRYAAHAIDSKGDLIHLEVCVDCVMFMANGDVPDSWE